MLILFWLICAIALVICMGMLSMYLLTNEQSHSSLKVLKQGMLTALKQSGFKFPEHRYPVELYVWEQTDNVICKQCEDAHERCRWPAMDIADWMKLGLPGTPESNTSCGENCQCQLVKYNPAKHGAKIDNR